MYWRERSLFTQIHRTMMLLSLFLLDGGGKVVSRSYAAFLGCASRLKRSISVVGGVTLRPPAPSIVFVPNESFVAGRFATSDGQICRSASSYEIVKSGNMKGGRNETPTIYDMRWCENERPVPLYVHPLPLLLTYGVCFDLHGNGSFLSVSLLQRDVTVSALIHILL